MTVTVSESCTQVVGMCCLHRSASPVYAAINIVCDEAPSFWSHRCLEGVQMSFFCLSGAACTHWDSSRLRVLGLQEFRS